MALSYKTKMTEIPVKKTPGIQVLIADDPSLLRDRIKCLLNSLSNISMVYKAENGADVLQFIREYFNEEMELLTESNCN